MNIGKGGKGMEIKSVDGRILYVAHAKDIRTAVEQGLRAGANLAEANLTRANLAEAYLRWANLTGANLTRANLDGANLDRGTWAQVAETLRVSLSAMNDNGRHWIKGDLERTLDDGSQAYCSVGSLNAHSEGTVRALAGWILAGVCGGSIEGFNDAEETTWEDIQEVFGVAIRHAERFARRGHA